MKICNTVPNGTLLEQIDDKIARTYHVVDCEMFLTDSKYANYYMKQSGQILLRDNVSRKARLTEVVEQLRPFEIVTELPPHYPKDTDSIVEYMTAQTRLYASLYMHHICLVIDGNDMMQFILAAMQLQKLPNVSSLGINTESAQRLANGKRSDLVRSIVHTGTDIHLLGMLDSMEDVNDNWLRSHTRVIGVSGDRLIHLGYNGVYAKQGTDLSEHATLHTIDWRNTTEPLTENAIDTIKSNIVTYDLYTR